MSVSRLFFACRMTAPSVHRGGVGKTCGYEDPLSGMLRETVNALPDVSRSTCRQSVKARCNGVRTHMLRAFDNCRNGFWHLPSTVLAFAIHCFGSCHPLFWQLPSTVLAVAIHCFDSCHPLFWQLPSTVLAVAIHCFDNCHNTCWQLPTILLTLIITSL